MKRTILILILLFSLSSFTGCFGGNDNQSESQLQNFSVYSAPTFSISIPNQWQTIEPKDFSNDVPEETQIIFRDNVQSDIFTANANVTKDIARYV